MAFESPWLTPQSVTIPLVGGVDKKSDSKAVQPPKLLALESASFFAPGELSKDRGYASLTASTLDGAAIARTPRRLAGTVQQQVMLAGSNVYQRVSAADRFALQGTLDSGTGLVGSTSVETIDAKNTTDANVDYAYANGYEAIFAAQSAASNFSYLIRERLTKTVLWESSNLQQTVGSIVKAFTTSDGWLGCIFRATGTNNLTILRWNTSTPGTAPVSNTVANDMQGLLLDVCPLSGGNIAIAYWQNATNKLAQIVYRPSSATVITSGVSAAAWNVDRCLCICADSGNATLVVWADSVNGLKSHGFTAASVVRSVSTLDAGATTANNNVVTACDIGNATNAVVAYKDGSPPGIKRLQCATSGAGLTTGPFAALNRYGTITHKAFLVQAGVVAFGVARSLGFGAADVDNIAATVVADTASGLAFLEPIAWYLYQLTAPAQGSNACSAVVLDGSEYRFALCERSSVAGIGAVTDYQPAAAIGSLRFDDGSAISLFGVAALAGGSYIAHGQGFADVSVRPQPRITAVASSATAGSLVVGGVYQYQAVHEFRDQFGNVIQSVPSAASSVTIGAGNSSANVTVTLPFARRSMTVTTRLYRTINGGAVHYCVAINTTNDAFSGASITLNDGEADGVIQTRQVLYTDEGILEAFPPPHGRCWCIHQARIFCIDEHSGELRYTRELVEGEGPAWHPNLALDLRGNGIDAKALVSTNNGLWIFGRDLTTGNGAIQFLVGDGPNDGGLGSSYSPQRLEGVTVSCTNHRLAVATPVGVLFWDASQGLHILRAQSAPEFVGAEVQKLITSTPISMDVMADRKEARVITSDPAVMLVWHYDVNQWSLRSLANAGITTVVDSCMWSGQHVILGSTGGSPVLVRQTADAAGSYADAASFYRMSFDTSWIKLAAFAGLQRVWKIVLLGRLVGDTATATATIRYDYETVLNTQTVTWSNADLTAASHGLDGVIELEIEPNQQECEAISIHFEDGQSGGVATDWGGIAITAIRIDYGALQRRGRNVDAAVKG